MIALILEVAVFAAFGYIVWFLIKNRKYYFGIENRHKYFAEYFKDFPVFHNERVLPMKKKLFEPLQTLESKFPDLQKKKSIRVLEIGAGTGANFMFYKNPKTSLIVVDPNPFFKKYLTENLEKFPNVELERCVVAGAENMKDIPDASVDAVVSTLVLCSVPDLQKVYQEIRRVLVPEGKFYFMEHIIDDGYSWLRLAQKFLGITGIWQFFFDGCRPDKDIVGELYKGGFSKVDVKRFYFDVTNCPPGCGIIKYVKSHMYGTAIN